MTTARVFESIRVPQAASIIPPPLAAANGYNCLTWNSSTYSPYTSVSPTPQAWYNFNRASTPVGDQAVNNSDGSMSISGVSGVSYGASVCSMYQASAGVSNWKGKVFGGGWYTELVAKWPSATGTSPYIACPTYWMLSLDFMTLNTLTWPGQANGYIHRIELDILQSELVNNNTYWSAIDVIDWYGTSNQNVAQPSNGLCSLFGANVSNYNTYGCLYVPATATKNAFIVPTFQVGYGGQSNVINYLADPGPIQWQQYSAANAPPPVAGTTAGSLTDVSQFALILGTAVSGYQMDVKSVRVWQASEANNTVQ
jgi:hypothetical protein